MPNIALIIHLIRYLKNSSITNQSTPRISESSARNRVMWLVRLNGVVSHRPGGTLNCPLPLPPSFEISTTALSNASVSTVSSWPHRRHLQSPSNQTPLVSSEENRERRRSTRETEGSTIGEEESLSNFVERETWREEGESPSCETRVSKKRFFLSLIKKHFL